MPKDHAAERYNKAIGRRIAELRLGRGLTQDQAARRIGIATRTLCRYEAGESGMPMLVGQAFARLFGLTLDGLVRGISVPRGR